ncbi:hypothetical protein ACLB0R_13485 [Sphingomonas sp. GlSt437]|uniref:hypothetical protein n=1 Tax=Sphingomonas sp. GlSt437 TaxID=3389970 RepID=UPI003A8B1023
MNTPLKWRYLGQLAGLLLSVAPVNAFAYCVGGDQTLPNYDPRYYSIAHEFRRSQYVVVATVIREIWIGEDGKIKALRPPFQFNGPRPWGFDPYIGAFYDLQVRTIYKGKPPAIIRVFSENTTARFWLRKGQKILGFVSPEVFDKPIGKQFTLDTCGNFSVFPGASRTIPAVLAAMRTRR